MSTANEAGRVGLERDLKEIELAEVQAQEEYESATKKYQKTIGNLADRYKTLLPKYKGLNNSKKEHSNKKSYVAVLVDANTINFKEDLLRAGSVGGAQAAERLNHTVTEYIKEATGNEKPSRIVVMMFADMRLMSLTAHEAKIVCTEELPALKAFAAGFNAAQASFNYIDVAGNYAVKKKLSANFDLFSEDSNCQHVILGVGEDPIYEKMVESRSAMENRVTLLCKTSTPTTNSHRQLEKVDFDSIFEGPIKSTENSDLSSSKGQDDTVEQEGTSTPNTGTKLCYHFSEKGKCNSSTCKFDHVPFPTNLYNLPTASPSNARGFDCIPVNKNNERLDMYVRQPTEWEWAAFNARVKEKPLCAYYHLTGHECEHESYHCSKSHEPISDDVRHVLRFIMSGLTCKERSQCRWPECYKGHHCQRYSCFWGPSHKCKMGPVMHGIDTKLDSWAIVRGTEKDKLPLEDDISLPGGSSGTDEQSQPNSESGRITEHDSDEVLIDL